MGSERRRNPRLGMAIAVRVQGYLPGGEHWDEVTQTDDVSAGGASFVLKRPVALGQVLYLTLALPRRLRQFDLGDATYRVYSLVRGITRRPDECRVGAMFFGKYPPRGFQETPWAQFLLPTDRAAQEGGMGAPPDSPDAPPAPVTPSQSLPPPTQPITPLPRPALPAPAPSPPAATAPGHGERRTHPRFQIFLNFTLQQVDEWGVVLQEELTVADNLSRGGTHVMTSLDFMRGDVVLLQEAGGGFATRAEIRAVREGPDGITRLHLKFLDRQAPERLLKA